MDNNDVFLDFVTALLTSRIQTTEIHYAQQNLSCLSNDMFVMSSLVTVIFDLCIAHSAIQ